MVDEGTALGMRLDEVCALALEFHSGHADTVGTYFAPLECASRALPFCCAATLLGAAVPKISIPTSAAKS